MTITTVAESTGARNRSSVFLSLLPPRDADRRTALLVVVLSTAVFLALIPFAKVPLAPAPAFIPAYQSALIFSDVLTSAVFFGQYAIQRTRGLLLLGSAYLFTALCIVPHTLTFPGLFAPEGVIGAGPQTTVWLYMLWHAGFPLMMLAYAFIKDDDRPVPRPWAYGLLSVVAVVVLVAGGTLLTTAGKSLLPMLLLPDNTYTPTMTVLVLTVWLLSPLALLLLWWRRPHSTLDFWMMVVMVAWTCDVGLSAALNAKRFDLGFYVGRMYGLMAAGFVLVMLLLEVRALYARLAVELSAARDASERELQRSRELYRSLFQTNPNAVTISDLETRHILDANNAAVAQYGWSRDELRSMDIKDLIAAEDLSRVLAWRKTLALGMRQRIEGIRQRRKDGNLIDVDIVAHVIDYNGRPAVLKIASDVSARLKMERLAQRVFEASQDVIVIIDSRGHVVQASPSTALAFGYEPEEIIGRTTSELIYPDDLERAQDEVRAARRTGTSRNFRCRYVSKDGRPVSLFWRGVWSEADHQYFFIGRDMTEIEAKEDQLRQSQKMEAVGQLTGGVAHDFNNILMVILANVEEVLEDSSLSPEQRTLLDGARTSGERAAELTRRLLAFSRKQRLTPQPTNLTDLVTGTDKLLRRTLGEQVEIEAILASDLWTANIDRAQLEAALLNLCVNARDAMPRGGRLLIETSNVELDHQYAMANADVVPGQYVMLSVSDTGSGIPPDLLNKVFDPFFTTKEVGKGTGLGLSMVYGFIKQSNGHVKIYSELGRGTTVRMYLPRSDVTAAEQAPVATALPRGIERVLLVEDDEQVRKTVLSQLRSLGYSVTEADGGRAGLDRIEAGEVFDLMLTDVVMPGIDGPQLAKAAEERRPTMKVIFMSGYSEHAAINHGRVAPDAQILSKPFRKVDLAKRIREVLDR